MTESEGKTLAERYCSGAEHCCLEVRQMLERRKAESADIERMKHFTEPKNKQYMQIA